MITRTTSAAKSDLPCSIPIGTTDRAVRSLAPKIDEQLPDLGAANSSGGFADAAAPALDRRIVELLEQVGNAVRRRCVDADRTFGGERD